MTPCRRTHRIHYLSLLPHLDCKYKLKTRTLAESPTESTRKDSGDQPRSPPSTVCEIELKTRTLAGALRESLRSPPRPSRTFTAHSPAIRAVSPTRHPPSGVQETPTAPRGHPSRQKMRPLAPLAHSVLQKK